MVELVDTRHLSCRANWRGGSTPPPSTKFTMKTERLVNQLDQRVEELEIAVAIAKDRLTAIENPTSIIDHELVIDPLTESKKVLEETRNILKKIKGMHLDILMVRNDLKKSNDEVIKRMEEFAEYFNMPKTFHIRRELKGGQEFSNDLRTISMRRKDEIGTDQQEDSGKA